MVSPPQKMSNILKKQGIYRLNCTSEQIVIPLFKKSWCWIHAAVYLALRTFCFLVYKLIQFCSALQCCIIRQQETLAVFLFHFSMTS